LLDAYGTIEPVDVPAMEKLFGEIVEKRMVQSTHWASLIQSYGCVQKNLDKAIEIFEALPNHPANKQGKMPDALVFEALINVFVTLRRPDLIPTYLQRLSEFGLHMTAYIANLLIKGYAAAGQLGESRRIFEALEDPPVGVAAPNNHAPHEGDAAAAVSADAPVFREVSARSRTEPSRCAHVFPCSLRPGKPWSVPSLEPVTAMRQRSCSSGCRQGTCGFSQHQTNPNVHVLDNSLRRFTAG
jgi:hypothetical protein